MNACRLAGRLAGMVSDETPASLEYGAYRGSVVIDAHTGEWQRNLTAAEHAALALGPPIYSLEYADLRPILIAPETPVGAVEIARLLDVERATVDKWRQRGVLPAPDWTVGGRPAWRWTTIEDWAIATRRWGGWTST